jgi:hypothetical protein
LPLSASRNVKAAVSSAALAATSSAYTASFVPTTPTPSLPKQQLSGCTPPPHPAFTIPILYTVFTSVFTVITASILNTIIITAAVL